MIALVSDPKKPLKSQTQTAYQSSGISNILNNNDKPVNTFIITSKPPPLIYTLSTESIQPGFSPSSFDQSSAYFTASLPNSISNEHQYNRLCHTFSSTVSSSSYFDSQSEYEVILDDGTSQKPTVSLSTIQLVSPKKHAIYHRTIKSIFNFKSPSADRHDDSKPKETSRLLGKHSRIIHMPISQSSDNNDDYDDYFLYENEPLSGYKRFFKKCVQFQGDYLRLSHKQKMVLKCSIAYMIGSLFTFLPVLNSMCGTHIASHMAATVTIFFNPAKSVGNMVEASGFACLYTIAALTICIGNMATMNYFLKSNMPTTGAVASLGVWLACGTFVISYLKARINTQSVSTASILAFMIIFKVLLPQKLGNETESELDIIKETFYIVAIGSAISASVCVFAWPISASKKLRSDIDSNLSSTRGLLKVITKAFLLNSDLIECLANKTLETALKSHCTSLTSLKLTLKSARFEFYNLEMRLHGDGYHKIVESLERLAQHVIGLKNSCGLQVEVMHKTDSTISSYGAIPSSSLPEQLKKIIDDLKAKAHHKKMGSKLRRDKQKHTSSSFPDINDNDNGDQINKQDSIPVELIEKEKVRTQFIRAVRSPVKSLAYTCKQTIISLQTRFNGRTSYVTPSFDLMLRNLVNAIELFETSQHQALEIFYQKQSNKYHRNINTDENIDNNIHTLFLEQQQKFPTDDVFLVYFFVFYLLEFAKELLTLVESVKSVFEKMEELDKASSIISWKRYFLNRKSYTDPKTTNSNENKSFDPINYHTLSTLHTPEPKTRLRKALITLWGLFSEIRTPRALFALKSMLIVELITVLAFIPLTRPYFTDFKIEWTLITVMAVMTPTVGGAIIGAVLRIFVTVLGYILAAFIYTIFCHNVFMLCLMTWLISIPSYWMILHQKYGEFGSFTLLAYSLIALGKFNISNDDSVNVFELTWRQSIAVSIGIAIVLVVTAYVWPYKAGKQVTKNLSDLFLRFSWLYKQLISVYLKEDVREYDNKSIIKDMLPDNRCGLTSRNKGRAIGLQKIELSIQLDIFNIQVLLQHTPNKLCLKESFPFETYKAMLESCQNILNKFVSLRIVILKDIWAIHVRRYFLMPASQELMDMSGNIFLYFYLLASALHLKTPLPPFLPPDKNTRQLLMNKLQLLPLAMEESIQEHRLTQEKRNECYMIYYAYIVLMESIIHELELLGNLMKELFGSIVSNDQWSR